MSFLPSKRFWRLIVALTLLYLAALAADVSPYLRGPAPMSIEWRWPRYERLPFVRLWLPLCVLTVYLGALALVDSYKWPHSSTRARRGLVLVLVLATLAVGASVLYLARPDIVELLFDRIVSHTSDGYYTAALAITKVGTFLRNYASLMPTFASDHPRTHPPGFPLLHWALGQTIGQWAPLRTWVRWNACPTLRTYGLSAEQITSALIVGLGTPLVGALAVLPLYALGRRRGTPRDGYRAAALLALVPAFILFIPQMDHLYPLLTSLIIYAFMRGWDTDAPGWLLLSGVLLSLATFLSLGLAALALWLGTYALLQWIKKTPKPSRTRTATGLLAFALGALSLWLALWLAFGLNPLAVYRTGMAQHFEIVTARRSYGLWVWYNLYDFAAFVGLPVAILFGVQVLDSIRHLIRRNRSQIDAIALSTAVTLLAVDLSGTSRGEVARIWLLFVPGVVLAAIPALHNKRRFLVVAALQAATLLVLALFVDTVAIVPLPALDRSRSLPRPPEIELSALFDDQIELLGYDLTADTVDAGQPLELTLYWQARSEPLTSYKVFVHLTDGNQTVAQTDGIPASWALPTTCWIAGEKITDPHQLVLPATLAPGTYTLYIGLYDPQTGERLVSPVGDRLRLTSIQVSPP